MLDKGNPPEDWADLMKAVGAETAGKPKPAKKAAGKPRRRRT
jgi:hypothetical protein